MLRNKKRKYRESYQTFIYKRKQTNIRQTCELTFEELSSVVGSRVTDHLMGTSIVYKLFVTGLFTNRLNVKIRFNLVVMVTRLTEGHLYTDLR